MSTKISIARGDDFHFYQKGLEKDAVYLTLHNTPFEATQQQVTVQIPADVWETIRHLAGINFDLLEATDQDIEERATKEVDEQLERYKKKNDSKKDFSLAKVSGFLLFKSIDEPREKQIKSGIEYFRDQRRQQQEIMRKINQHDVIKRAVNLI